MERIPFPTLPAFALLHPIENSRTRISTSSCKTLSTGPLSPWWSSIKSRPSLLAMRTDSSRRSSRRAHVWFSTSGRCAKPSTTPTAIHSSPLTGRINNTRSIVRRGNPSRAQTDLVLAARSAEDRVLPGRARLPSARRAHDDPRRAHPTSIFRSPRLFAAHRIRAPHPPRQHDAGLRRRRPHGGRIAARGLLRAPTSRRSLDHGGMHASHRLPQTLVQCVGRPCTRAPKRRPMARSRRLRGPPICIGAGRRLASTVSGERLSLGAKSLGPGARAVLNSG